MSALLEFLNDTIAARDILFWGLIMLATWCILWHLFLGDWLHDHDVTTFWYAMYELGPVGTFGLALMILLIIVLFITSIQAAFIFGGKLILAICAFWGGLAFCLIKLINSIRK